jgi:hypothetical protein
MGSLACLGCGRAGRVEDTGGSPGIGSAAAAEMSFEEVFHFAYARSFIPTMKILADRVGVEVIREAACESAARAVQSAAASLPDRGLASWAKSLKKPNRVLRHALAFDIVEESETAFEVRVTECLWASTFRNADASELGYNWVCHPDFDMARAFNPDIRLHRDRTLMQGATHCNHRWEVLHG